MRAHLYVCECVFVCAKINRHSGDAVACWQPLLLLLHTRSCHVERINKYRNIPRLKSHPHVEHPHPMRPITRLPPSSFGLPSALVACRRARDAKSRVLQVDIKTQRWRYLRAVNVYLLLCVCKVDFFCLFARVQPSHPRMHYDRG